MAKQKLNNSQDSANSYSSSEVAIGTWVDGSIIYRKCWEKNTVSDWNFAHGISGITRILNLRVAIRDSTNTSYRMLPWIYSASDAAWIAGVYADTTSIIFQDGGTTSIDDFTKSFIVLEYTK